jgi:transketolase
VSAPARTTGGGHATDAELEALALRVRAHCLRMTEGGGCFVGASLSCVDILVHLYARVLEAAPDRTEDPERDYLLLSKGHDVPALYGTLAELGFFPLERLANHLKPTDSLYWHPSRALPGVEFHSGSLGHLLAVGIGIALDAKLCGGRSRVFVVLGDGELDEGSVWEGLLVAAAQKLDNLVAVVDRNGRQANLRTEELVPLEPLADKLRAFGWSALEVDGHSFAELDSTFATLPARAGQPTAIVARTVRGKGVASLEDRADRWFCSFDAAEVEALVRELEGGERANVVSPGRVVR